MTTIHEAFFTKLGYRHPADGDLCFAIIDKDKGAKPLHYTVTTDGDMLIPSDKHVYFASGVFRPGSISTSGGRSIDNLVRILELPFDFDLKDYLQLPKKELWAASPHDLDAYIDSLATAVEEAFAQEGIPLHRLIDTGYGIGAFVKVSPQDQHRISAIRAVHATLTKRINALFAIPVVDKAVSDPGSRLMRLPGSLNVKGERARKVDLLNLLEPADHGAWLFVDDVPITPRTRAPQRSVTFKSLTPDAVQSIVAAVGNDYIEGRRHAICLGVAGMLAKAGVPENDALMVIDEIGVDDEDIEDRRRAVQTTYARMAMGFETAGYMLLEDFLPLESITHIDDVLRPLPEATITFHEPEPPLRPVPSPIPPPEAFYGYFGRYVAFMQDATFASDAWHLAAALTMVGAWVGRNANIPSPPPITPCSLR
jgi:hypothetical protein